MSIVHTTHAFEGLNVVLASRMEETDAYSEKLRSGKWAADHHARLASQLLSDEDYFIDLGANVGTFCIPVALVTGARCLAIEALQSNIAVLQSAIEANDLSDRIEWALAAIVDRDGEVHIRGESAYGTVGTTGRRVLGFSLDGLMEEVGWRPVSLVKMDIEGCEMKALNGATSFMERNPDVTFIFEANAAHCFANDHSPQDLIRFFEDAGKNVYMCRGGRLARRSSTDFQEAGLVDYVASPVPLEDKVSGFIFEDFSDKAKIESARHTLSSMNDGYKVALATQFYLAPEFMKVDAELCGLVDAVIARYS